MQVLFFQEGYNMSFSRHIIHTISTIMSMLLVCSSLQSQDLSQLMTDLGNAEDDKQKKIILTEIGAYYQRNQVYQKGIEYFNQALEIEKSLGKTDETTLRNLAYCYAQNKNYDQAINTNLILLTNQKQASDNKGVYSTLNQLTYLCTASEKYKEALNYSQEILKIDLEKNDQGAAIASYNNLGYLHKSLGNQEQSLANYMKAISLSQQYNKNTGNLNEKATILSNTGVTYSYLRDYANAQKYFQEALQNYEIAGNQSGVAQTYNYLAANQYISGKNEAAIVQALKAVEIATPINDESSLVISYQILADANQNIRELDESQKYYKLNQQLKEKIAERERKSQQKNLEEQINVEKKESEIKSLLAEQESRLQPLNNPSLKGKNKNRLSN